jgi:hypothetical protein
MQKKKESFGCTVCPLSPLPLPLPLISIHNIKIMNIYYPSRDDKDLTISRNLRVRY